MTRKKARALKPRELRAVCSPGKLGFKDTGTLTPLTEFINQERAISALKLGLTHPSDTYNIVVVNAQGSGKNSVLANMIREETRLHDTGSPPNDICFVFNFNDPQKPSLVSLPAGEGQKFREKILNLGITISQEIPDIIEGQEATSEYERLSEIIDRYAEELKEEFKTIFSAYGADIERKDGVAGFPPTVTIVCKGPDGNMIPVRLWASLPDLTKDVRKEREEIEEKMNAAFQEIGRKINRKQRELTRQLENLKENLVMEFLGTITDPVKEQFNTPAVLRFLEDAKTYVMRFREIFSRQEQPTSHASRNGHTNGTPPDPMLPFQVNVFVDNSGVDSKPVIEDAHGTFQSLFGQSTGTVRSAMTVTDHMRLISGSLAKANGGVLILDAQQIFSRDIAIWQKLVATLKNRGLKIEDAAVSMGFPMAATLDPEPIPIDIRLILVCPQWLYIVIVQSPVIGDQLKQYFRVKAEFKGTTERIPEREAQYARFVALCVEREELLPFNAGAVANIVEYGSRLAGHKDKLSLEMTRVKDIILEASWVATQKGARKVNAAHVSQALHDKVFRLDLIRELVYERYQNGQILFNPTGSRVGQLCGLAVLDTGEIRFGIPSRITAQVFASKEGEGGITSTDRNATLTGPTFQKALEIVSSYIQSRYAKKQPLKRGISISFEQTYGGIDGDSATAAKLLATLSALSGVPLKQDIATVTGSANQFGEIQPIGGVNEKIEGFFDVCTATCGIKGRGVVIPAQNVQNLMLREDVVKAVREGTFHIYSIETIEEGVELLTGKSMKEIDELIRENI